MPKYQVVLTDGRKFQVDADSQPSEQDILAQLGQASAPSTPAAPAAPERTWTDTAVDALPTLGGLAGGVIGGAGGTVLGMGVGGVPGAVGGAALGGGAGEAAKQLINRVRGAEAPATMGGAAGNIGASAAVQGAGELAGIGASKVIRPVAKGLYGVALRPVKALRDKYGLGQLIESGFANRIMPTAGGVAKAADKVAESKAAQRGMAEAYDAAGGAQLTPLTAAKRGISPIVKDAQAAEAATGIPANTKKIITQVRRVQAAHPQGMSAAETMDAKHVADTIADPAYAAMRRGGAVVEPTSKAATAKGWSKGYRETLNEAIGEPFAQQGRTTKTLYGVGQAAKYAAERPEMASTIMSGVGGAASSGGDFGKGLKNAVLLRSLAAPRFQAGTALAMPGVAQFAPRAIDALTGSNMEQYLRQALLARMGITTTSK